MCVSCNDIVRVNDSETHRFLLMYDHYFLFLLDAGQLCASCNGIAKVDDCHRFVRCENDEVGVMNQTKKSSNYPFLSPTRYCSSD